MPDTGRLENRRTSVADPKRIYRRLRERAFHIQPSTIPGVAFAAEPLLRRGESGLEQPLRIASARPVTDASITFPDGTVVRPPIETVGGGSRLFLPEVTDETEVLVHLPDLSDEPATVRIQPVRRWEISVVHHSHFDIGYTDLQGRVITEQLAYVDHALHLAEESAASAAGEFVWSVESIWVLREWISLRQPEVVDRFMAQVRAGRIEVAAMPFSVHTEACSTEELHGLLRYAAEISEKYQIELPLAFQTDVPGTVAGFVDALAENGVKYLALAHNWAGRSASYFTDGHEVPRLFRWAAPSGNSVLVWLTTSAQGMAYQEGAMLGFHESLAQVDDLLPLFLLSEQATGYPYDESVMGFVSASDEVLRGIESPYPWNEMMIRAMGRIGDNCPPNTRIYETVTQWNERWVYPQIRIRRAEDYMAEMESRHGHEVPTFTGDWNNWWTDGLGSSARYMQMNRATQAELPQIETIAATLDSPPSERFAGRVNQAWEAAELWDEHTWGAAAPWLSSDAGGDTGTDEWHWKAETALRAAQASWQLAQSTLHAVADTLGGGKGDAAVWVLNAAGRPRGGAVMVFLPEHLVDTRATIRLIDGESGAEIAFGERNQTNPVHRSAGRWVDFAIEEVPAVGRRRIDVIVVDPRGRDAHADGTVERVRATEPIWTLDNGRIRVEVDQFTGDIQSIRDLERDVELVNQGSALGFNAYIHDEFLTRGNLGHYAGFVPDFGPDLVLLSNRRSAEHASFVDAGRDGFCSWITYRVFGTPFEHVETTLRLPHGAAYLDIANQLTKQYTVNHESGYFAFPFALSEPSVRYEIAGAVAGTDIPRVPGGADYAHAVRDWVALHEGAHASILVTPDVPLVEIGDIALPFVPFPGTLAAPEPGTIVSWVHNNLWGTNFPQGEAISTTFRYRVAGFSATDLDNVAARSADLAASLTRPLIATAAGSRIPAIGPADARSSLFAVDNPRVRLLFVRRTAEGLLIGLQNLAAQEESSEVRFPSGVSSAVRSNLLGRDRQPVEHTENSATVTIAPHGTVGLVVEPR